MSIQLLFSEDIQEKRQALSGVSAKPKKNPKKIVMSERFDRRKKGMQDFRTSPASAFNVADLSEQDAVQKGMWSVWWWCLSRGAM